MAELKLCADAEHEGPNPLPVSEFGKDAHKRSGYRPWCRTCETRRHRRRYEADPERHRSYSRSYRQRNPEKQREATDHWERANPASHPERSRRNRNRVRDRVLSHYGHACACCGSVKRLTIDHINGEGQAHRLEIFGRSRGIGSTKFYRWLIANGFPPGYQVLCLPCNNSKGTGTTCRLDHQESA